jgi:hypothetical protein
MMIRTLLLIFITLSTFAKVDSLNLPFTPNEFYIDHLDYLYFIKEDATILKTNLKLDSLYTHEIKSNQISYLDVSNPLRVLALSERQNSIVFLDKTLTAIQTSIQLDLLNIPFVNAVANSRDNNFWVFNNQLQQLKKINQQSEVLLSSQQLNVILDQNFEAKQIIEHQNKVYLVDPKNGVCSFDFFGTFLFHYKQIKADKLQVHKNTLVYLQKGEIFTFDTQLMERKKVTFPVKNIQDFALNKNQIVLISKEKLYILPVSF